MKDLRLWGILLAGLALRGGLFATAIRNEAGAFAPDSQEYWYLSGAIIRGSYDSPPVFRKVIARSPADGPGIFRTPGYPAFLALGRSLPVWQGKGDAWRAALAVQVLVDVHLLLATFALGRELGGHRMGLLGALLQAVSPLAVGSCCRLLSDSLFAFLLTTAVWAFAVHLRRGDRRTLAATGVLLGLACYVRPVGLAMAAVFAVVLLLRGRGRWRRAGVLAGLVGMLVAPWVVRNAVVADYVGFSSFAEESAYLYSAAEVLAATDPEIQTAAEARDRLISEETGARSKPSGPVGTPGDRVRYRRRRAWEIISAHPWTYLGIHLKGCLAFWLPGATEVLEVAGLTVGGRGTLAVLHRGGLGAAVRHYFGGNGRAMVAAGAMVAVLLVRYAGVLLCVVRGVRRRVPAAAWLCVGLVLVAFLLPGPAGHPRFRVPVEPVLSVAAAAGLLGLRRSRVGAGPSRADAERSGG